MEKFEFHIPTELKKNKAYAVKLNHRVQLDKNCDGVNAIITQNSMKLFDLIMDNIPTKLQPQNWKQIFQKYKHKKYADFEFQIPQENRKGQLLFLKDGIIFDVIELLENFPLFPCGKVNWSSAQLQEVSSHRDDFELKLQISSRTTVYLRIWDNGYSNDDDFQIRRYVAIVSYWSSESNRCIQIWPISKLYLSFITDKEGKYAKNYMMNKHDDNDKDRLFHSFDDFPSKIWNDAFYWHSYNLEHRTGDRCSFIRIDDYGESEESFYITAKYKKNHQLTRYNQKPAIIKMDVPKNKKKSLDIFMQYWYYYEGKPSFYFPFFEYVYPNSSYIRNINGQQQLVCCFPELIKIYNTISRYLFDLCLMVRKNKISQVLVSNVLNYLFPYVPECYLRLLVSLMMQSMEKVKIHGVPKTKNVVEHEVRCKATNKNCFSGIFKKLFSKK
jgi:hypothetical protein